MQKGAIIDPTGKYRYLLTRAWDENEPPAVFIMLNPSTADANEDDPTIRRCINFAKAWGCGGIRVVNVFAYRATHPKELELIIDPVGEDNERYVRDAIADAGIIVAAWGSSGPKKRKYPYKKMLETLKDTEFYTLGMTADGHPRHPLYLSGKTMPKQWGKQGYEL